MGQKVKPIGFRLGYNQFWRSSWMATRKDMSSLLKEDESIRSYLKVRFTQSGKSDFKEGVGISNIKIERTQASVNVIIFSSKPGIIIGKSGVEVEKLKKELSSLIKKEVMLSVSEVRKPDSSAKLIADSIVLRIKKRERHSKIAKTIIASCMRGRDVKGIKIKFAGRLGGAEMAYQDTIREGNIPLHTIRADIDYAFCEALTIYGIVGIHVWIYNGESSTYLNDEIISNNVAKYSNKSNKSKK